MSCKTYEWKYIMMTTVTRQLLMRQQLTDGPLFIFRNQWEFMFIDKLMYDRFLAFWGEKGSPWCLGSCVSLKLFQSASDHIVITINVHPSPSWWSAVWSAMLEDWPGLEEQSVWKKGIATPSPNDVTSMTGPHLGHLLNCESKELNGAIMHLNQVYDHQNVVRLGQQFSYSCLLNVDNLQLPYLPWHWFSQVMGILSIIFSCVRR